MKIDIPKANQIKIIINFVLVAVIITLLVVFRKEIFKVTKSIPDNERFYKEYSMVDVDNVYKYVTASEAIELFKSEQAIVLFGFTECKWCQSYVPILNEVAKENGVQTIYYCNIKEDRKNKTEEYTKLVDILKEYLYEDDNNEKRIYVPDVYFIKDGKIVGHNNDTSKIESMDTSDYYSDKTKEELKLNLTGLIKKVYDSCGDDKRGC